MHKKLLTIIIPSYNTSQQTISPLLESIHFQVGIDFKDLEILICDDASTDFQLTDEFLQRFYPLEIKMLHCPTNGGPGLARQYGIDHCGSNFFICCDADDSLTSCDVLGTYIRAIMNYDNNPFDLVRGSFIEESEISNKKDNNGQMPRTYLPHTQDQTWMHAKMYSLKYIKEHNISFHPDLKVQEDTYFNGLVFGYKPRILELNVPLYIWRWNENSITRNSNQVYSVSSICQFIDAANLFLLRLNEEKIDVSISAAQVIFYLYFILQTPVWDEPVYTEYKKKTELRFFEFYIAFANIFQSVTDKDLVELYSNERTRVAMKNGPFIEKEQFARMLERICTVHQKVHPELYQESEERTGTTDENKE